MPFATIHDRIEAERKAALPDAARLKDFREYARGRQRGTLNAAQERVLRGLLGQLFCDNACKRVLAEQRNRLRLARFDVAGDGERATSLSAYLREVWTKSSIPALSAAAHWAILRDGNHGIGLRWIGDGGGRCTLKRERWWNGETGLYIHYDDDDRPEYAVREWYMQAGKRRTIYFPERIERYEQNGEGWRMFNLEADVRDGSGDIAPVRWRDRRNEPLGIPFVHFANLQVPNEGKGTNSAEEPDARYGSSELDGGFLGLQDEINDVHRDLTAGGRFAGFGMLTATGTTAPKDDAGNDVPFRPEPGGCLHSEDGKARFGMLQPSSLEELERLLTIKLLAVSRMSGVPQHLIAGDFPSGEALLRAERPLVDKVETLGASVGPAWSSVMHKAVRFSNTFAGTDFDEEMLIVSVFAPAERRDQMTLAAVAEKLSPFVSKREVLRLLNYAPADIDRILQEMADEFQASSAAMGQQMLRAFNAGV